MDEIKAVEDWITEERDEKRKEADGLDLLASVLPGGTLGGDATGLYVYGSRSFCLHGEYLYSATELLESYGWEVIDAWGKDERRGYFVARFKHEDTGIKLKLVDVCPYCANRDEVLES